MHSYYEDNICKGLVYKPSIATEKIIKRFSLKLNLTNKGIELYTDTTKSITEFLNYITTVTGEESFDFNTTTKDSTFYQFTNLPINQIGITVFNSSLTGTILGVNSIELKPNFIPKTETNILFNVSINFNDLIALDTNKEVASYRIQFEARATQWKYYILNNTNQNLGALSIDNTSGIDFEGPVEVTLQNGEKADMFYTEKQLLALSEIPKYDFTLISTTKRNGVNRNKILFKGLPNPNPNTMEIHNGETQLKVVSLMYVYV